MELVSIIIPVFNGEKYIEETVNTVNQIKHNKEIIIVNDGSRDSSADICKRLAANNPEIKYFEKKNGGIVSARNYGIENALGKYICFCDQDDIVVPQTVDYAIERIDEADILFWTTKRLSSGHSEDCDTVYKDKEYNTESIKDILVSQMLFNFNNTDISYIGHLWACLYKLEFIRENGIHFKKYVDIEDDYLFVFDCLIYARKALAIKNIGYYWRTNPSSETYRLKFISDISSKYKNLFSYTLGSAKAIGVEPKVLSDYAMYAKQYSLVWTCENDFNCLNPDHKAYAHFKKLLYSDYYRGAFSGKIVLQLEECDKRRRRILWLLCHKLVFFAYIYVYGDSSYRKMRQSHLGANNRR